MTTLAFTIINYEEKNNSWIQTVTGKTRESCYKLMKYIIIEYFKEEISKLDEYSQDLLKNYNITMDEEYFIYYETLSSFVLDGKYLIVQSFIN